MEDSLADSLYSIPLKTIDGKGTSLGAWRGKVLLIVNVASKCGLTPQYKALEELYEEKRDEGLVVLGFPTNDFGAQEPGTNKEIVEFCSTRYGVSFPMFEKISVKGANQHLLYRRMIAFRPQATDKPDANFKAMLAGHGIKQRDPRDVLWNFEKFLIGRDGEVVGRFAPDFEPQNAILRDVIDRQLAKRPKSQIHPLP